MADEMTEIRRLAYAYAVVVCATIDNHVLSRAIRGHLRDWRQPSEPDDPAHRTVLADVWRVVALCQSPAVTEQGMVLSDAACTVHYALELRASDGENALSELYSVRNSAMVAIHRRVWNGILAPPWDVLGAYVDALAAQVNT